MSFTYAIRCSIYIQIGNQIVTTIELAEYTSKSRRTISKHLNHLIELKLIRINGNKYDFNHTYELVTN